MQSSTNTLNSSLSNPNISSEPTENNSRIESKLGLARKMLLFSGVIQVFYIVYSFIQLQSANALLFKGAQELQMPVQAGAWMSIVSFPQILCIGLIIYAVRELNKSPWGWVGALSAGLMSLGTWGVVFGVIALLNLLEKSVREKYLEELDISL